MSGLRLRVLYDGWPVVFAPASPASLHLLALLEHLPPEVEAVVALPGPAPQWLPPSVQAASYSIANDLIYSRLRWEQRTLPSLAHRMSARLLHLFEPNLPLASPVPMVVSPCLPIPAEGGVNRPASFAGRFRYALSRATRGSMGGLLWPADLAAPGISSPAFILPPIVPSVFTSPEQPALPDGLPDGFCLYHHTGDPAGLRRALAAWVWAGPPLEGDAPLVIAGLSAEETNRLPQLMQTFGILGGIQALPAGTPADLAALYHHASALFCPSGTAPWGDALLLAQAVGLPTAALETPEAAARCGPAAYLAPVDDPRAQAAALVSLIFEEGMAQELGEAARLRADAWHTDAFDTRLLAAYQAALESA